MPRYLVHRRGYSYVNDSASIAPGSIYHRLELRRGFMTLANINCCVSSCAHAAAWPHGQLSTIHIRVPNRGSIRPNTNSPFGPLFGPVQIWIEYSVQP